MKAKARAIGQSEDRKIIALPATKDSCGYQLLPQLWFGLGVAAILVQFVERGQLNPMPYEMLSDCGRCDVQGCGEEFYRQGVRCAINIDHLDDLERVTYTDALAAGLAPLGLLVEFHPATNTHTCEGEKKTPAHVCLTIGPASPERLGGGIPVSSIEDL